MAKYNFQLKLTSNSFGKCTTLTTSQTQWILKQSEVSTKSVANNVVDKNLMIKTNEQMSNGRFVPSLVHAFYLFVNIVVCVLCSRSFVLRVTHALCTYAINTHTRLF